MFACMRIATASVSLFAVLAVPLFTLASTSPAERDLSPEQSQALFQSRKAWAQGNYQRRLDLLQS